MVETEIQNDWQEYQEALTFLTPYWQDIDANIAYDTKCPKCGKFMRYEGYGTQETVTSFSGNPYKKLRYKYAFAICDDCQIAWSF